MIEILAQKLDPKAKLMKRAYPGDAGIDLPVLEPVVVPTGRYLDVRTGWAVAIPEGFFGRIVGRSSTLRKRGLIVIEGVIDSGFRGELFACCYCPPANGRSIRLSAGESVAQLIITPVPNVDVTILEHLPPSVRGDQGFGSSGL